MYRGCLEVGLDRYTKVGRTNEKQGNNGELCFVGSGNFVVKGNWAVALMLMIGVLDHLVIW